VTKDLEYYLNLPWSYRFEWSEVDNAYIASIEELKGCMSHGDTIEEATAMIKDALMSYIDCHLHFGDFIPEPAKIVDFKGKIHFRTTPKKHFMLDRSSKVSGKSINKIIDEALDCYFENTKFAQT
jgi:antitoxin HicB